MGVLMMGMNHHTAPIEVRESVVSNSQSILKDLSSLQHQADLSEVAILNTCNRTEIYYDVQCKCQHRERQSLCTGGCDRLQNIKERIINYLDEYSQLPVGSISPFLYEYQDNEMVRHTMRVASGLNSMVLGEPQILGQMKECYQKALEAGTAKNVLLRLFETIFSSAKKVRTETGIGSEPISIASIAVKMIAQFYTSLNNKKVVMIGAGDTIRLVSQHIRSLDSHDYVVLNRHVKHAKKLVKNDPHRAFSLEQLDTQITKADVIISCTGSEKRIISAEKIKQIMALRPKQRLLLIDLALPRDIDPKVKDMSQVYLYTVDDLEHIAKKSLAKRQEKTRQANQIIEDYEDQFMQWLSIHNLTNKINALRQNQKQMSDELLQKYLKKIQCGEDANECLKQFSEQLTNKLLHSPTITLKQAIKENNQEYIQLLSRLYNI